MAEIDGEDDLLRSVALQNAQAILLARQRAEADLVRAKEALELRSRELAQSLAMMRATLESTTDGILVTDERGTITDFNENYVALWALPREVLESRRHARVLEVTARAATDPLRFVARVEEVDASGAESFDVLELADGRVFERFSRIQSVDGRNIGRVWSVRDITARRRAEDALREETRLLEILNETAQKAAEERKRLLESEQLARGEAERASATKDQFLATLSHELRTPLSAILGWVQMLRLPSLGARELQRGLEVIDRNTRIQIQLIEDLLDMSRITLGQAHLEIRPLAPETVIEAALETVRHAAEAKSIQLEFALESTSPVAGDSHRLQQIVWNLLANAIKFTGAGGHVRVSLRRVAAQVEIGVTDTGIGITAEFLPQVFDRFRQAESATTRHAGGLGLGLAIVKHLAELHGGSVSAESPGQGRGSTFTVRLPVISAEGATAGELGPRAATGPALDFSRVDLARVKVLVVDDDADARDAMQGLLRECGADVITAATAGEALLAVEQARPQVLVSDIAMPDVDGYELLRLVRGLGQSRGGGIPAIALTAYARSEDRTQALRAGFLVHCAKPVDPSEFVATVASVVGRTGDPIRA